MFNVYFVFLRRTYDFCMIVRYIYVIKAKGVCARVRLLVSFARRSL